MLKGILSGLLALKILDGSSETVKIFDLKASGVFYFLPFYLAVSVARIFKTSEYLALALASALMYPTLMDAAIAGQIKAFHFFGLPIPVIKYSSTVIPIIISVWAMKYIHKYVDNFNSFDFNSYRTIGNIFWTNYCLVDKYYVFILKCSSRIYCSRNSSSYHCGRNASCNDTYVLQQL